MFVSDIMNATSSFLDSSGSLLGLIVLMGIGVGVMAILLLISSNIEKYRRFKRVFKFLYNCFNYCAYGMLTIAIVGIPVYLGYIGFTYAEANPEAMFETLKLIGVIAGGFIGFTIMGYCTKNRIWKRIFKYHKQENDEKFYKDLIKELPGIDDNRD